MKEFIKYFYNIKVDELINEENNYFFKSSNKFYQFVSIELNTNELCRLYKLYLFLKNNGICCHDIVLNKDNSFISNYNNKGYLLLKENINSRNFITIADLLNPILVDNEKYEIKEKWEIKNDYYEDLTNKIYFNNLDIVLNFDYFLGLSELSINLLNYIDIKNIKCYVQHKRLKYNETLIDFFNPLNMTLDSKIRDLSFYIKNIFFFAKGNEYDIKKILNYYNFNDDEAILFLARMIYPDYYFDIYESIVYQNLNNVKLKQCIKKSVEYETLLKRIYKYLYKKYNIPTIEWLNTI